MASMPFFVPCTPRMLIGAHRFSLNTSYCTAQQGRETLAMQAGNTGLSSPGNRQASWSRLTGQFIHETGCATSYWTYGLSGRGTGGNCLISCAAAEGVGNEDIGYKPYPSAIGETRHLDHSGSSAILDPADPFLWIQRPNTCRYFGRRKIHVRDVSPLSLVLGCLPMLLDQTGVSVRAACLSESRSPRRMGYC